MQPGGKRQDQCAGGQPIQDRQTPRHAEELLDRDRDEHAGCAADSRWPRSEHPRRGRRSRLAERRGHTMQARVDSGHVALEMRPRHHDAAERVSSEPGGTEQQAECEVVLPLQQPDSDGVVWWTPESGQPAKLRS